MLTLRVTFVNITRQMELWFGVAAAVMFVVSLLAVPFLLTRIPVDYFARSEPRPMLWQRHHPALRWTLHVLKNLCGILLLLAGIVMLFTPGQGVLTVLVGVALMDFPGKRRLELWLVRRPSVLTSINWIRQRTHHPPLVVPPVDDGRAVG